jgi:hypothetical protein
MLTNLSTKSDILDTVRFVQQLPSWPNETSWCQSDALLLYVTRWTKSDQLVKMWQNYECFCDEVGKMWPAGAIVTQWWLGGAKLTKWGQLLSVWQCFDWMWPSWQKGISCVHMLTFLIITLEIQSIPVCSMKAMSPSWLPLPLLGSVAAGHRTIRFLLQIMLRKRSQLAAAQESKSLWEKHQKSVKTIITRFIT